MSLSVHGTNLLPRPCRRSSDWRAGFCRRRRTREMPKRRGSRVRRAPTPPPTRAPAQSEEERVRRFFEALGVPTSASPPPKVQPRQITHQETKREGESSRPSTRFRCHAPEGFHRRRSSRPLPTSPATRLQFPRVLTTPQERIPATTRVEPAAANFEVHDIDEGWLAESIPGDSTSSPQGIGTRLVTTDGLRDAIVLREIFGPPRSMQPFSHSALG